MSADRTIDIRIAELLGATWTREPEASADWLSFPQVEPRTKNPIHLRVLAARFDDGRIEAWPALLHYREDIGAAWLAVEHMSGFRDDREGRRKWLSFALFHAQRNQVGCRVYVCLPGSSIFDTSEIIAERVAGDAAHAICLAALDAFANARPPLPTGGEE